MEVDGQHQARLDREEKEMKTEVEVDGQHQHDLREKGLSDEEAQYWAACRRLIRNINFPHKNEK